MDEDLKKARRLYQMDPNKSTREYLRSQIRRIYGFSAKSEVVFAEILNFVKEYQKVTGYLPLPEGSDIPDDKEIMKSLTKYPYTPFCNFWEFDPETEDELEDLINLYGWRIDRRNQFFVPDMRDFNKSIESKVPASNHIIQDFGIDLLEPILESIQREEGVLRIDELDNFEVSVKFVRNREWRFYIILKLRKDQIVYERENIVSISSRYFFEMPYSILTENPPIYRYAIVAALNIRLGKLIEGESDEEGDRDKYYLPSDMHYDKYYLPIYTHNDFNHPYGLETINFVPWEDGFQIVVTFDPDLYFWSELLSRNS